jgi:hypothetical protein
MEKPTNISLYNRLKDTGEILKLTGRAFVSKIFSIACLPG